MSVPHGVTHEESVPPQLDLAAALESATRRLARAGLVQARVDALLLAGHVLGVSRGRVEALAVTGRRLEPAAAARFDEGVRRRAGREPLQHITGRAPFRTIELCVGPGVFIPRPETEVVAGLAIDALRAAGPGALAVDLGTGSGAIAASLAVEVPQARVIAVEKSPAAWAWARRNLDRIAPRVRLVRADFATAPGEAAGQVDVVVSNPPYVPAQSLPEDAETRRDPPQALYSGADGLDAVRLLAHRAARLTRPGGVVVLEHGADQGAQVRRILQACGWSDVATHRDLTGRERATTARLPGARPRV